VRSWLARQLGFSNRERTAFACAALLLSCASTLREPTAADAALLRTRYADASLEDLSRGRTRYIARCAGCHALKSPSSVTRESWRAEVRQMREKFGVRLDPAEGEAIVRYLEAVSPR